MLTCPVLILILIIDAGSAQGLMILAPFPEEKSELNVLPVQQYRRFISSFYSVTVIFDYFGVTLGDSAPNPAHLESPPPQRPTWPL